MSSTGLNNWSKPYIPGRESPSSLMRFIPHDEEVKESEFKHVYQGRRRPRSRRKKPPSSRRAAFALVNRRS
jgi:hypothetical protein